MYLYKHRRLTIFEFHDKEISLQENLKSHSTILRELNAWNKWGERKKEKIRKTFREN
jgi:hypothetical protein